MDLKIYNAAISLKQSMDEDPRFVLLKKLEQEMENDEEVMRLSYQKDMANDRYNDLIKYFDDDHEDVIKARKNLLEAKERLESHPLVKEYLKVHKEITMLLYQVNDILFSDFKGGKC